MPAVEQAGADALPDQHAAEVALVVDDAADRKAALVTHPRTAR